MTVSKKVGYVLNGYRNLSGPEKKEFLDAIRKDGEDLKKGIIKEGERRIDIVLGPIAGGCACCGRS